MQTSRCFLFSIWRLSLEDAVSELKKVSVVEIKPKLWIVVYARRRDVFNEADLSMNGVQSHSHAPTHASIYLDVLSSRVQNLYDELIAHKHIIKCTPLSFCK